MSIRSRRNDIATGGGTNQPIILPYFVQIMQFTVFPNLYSRYKIMKSGFVAFTGRRPARIAGLAVKDVFGTA